MSDRPNSMGDYELLTPLPAASVRVRFAGHFQGREVMWSAEILTLAAWLGRQGAGLAGKGRAFIDVGGIADGFQTVSVGLPVEEIDEPAVRKCVIMLRNYKRLRPGRHEYGSEFEVGKHESI